MSAITGLFYRDGRKLKAELIKKMNEPVSHRGPDGSGFWMDENIALGHQMLWTTTESLHENLPFHDEKSSLVITADARIDNRKELSETLNIPNEEYISDSYFILKSYEKWADKCPEYLLGDFAFAIWDKKQNKLFCARDHMGVKPFYYYLDDEMFVFGTEIKSILSIPNLDFKLDEERLANFLMVTDFFDKKNTFYKNIKSLAAACSIIIEKNQIKSDKYWKLDPKNQIIMDSDSDYANSFREIFTEAVRCRLRSHVPPGVMLSGGLDSSSVACIANKINSESKIPEKIHSFSYIFDNYPDIDERNYINKVLDETELEFHFIKCDEINPLEKIEDRLKSYDQPLNTYQIGVIQESRKIMNLNGIRVLLTGEGGDQIVSHGSNYLEELLVTFQWKKLVKNIDYISKVREVNKFKLFINTILRLSRYYVIKGPFLYKFLKNKNNILDKKFFSRLKLSNSNKKERFHGIPNSKKTHYNDIEMNQHQLGFEMLDQDSSIFCIDTRHPFYDKRLVEFCYAIPTEMKIKFGWSRYICRIAMDGILPEKIQWRSTKSKIGIAGANNFLANRKILKKIIADHDEIIRSYIDLYELQNAFKISMDDKTSRSTIYLWRTVLFYFWLLKNKDLIDK